MWRTSTRLPGWRSPAYKAIVPFLSALVLRSTADLIARVRRASKKYCTILLYNMP
jgi:hypothetical protein